jgi:hypothetical protein
MSYVELQNIRKLVLLAEELEKELPEDRTRRRIF